MFVALSVWASLWLAAPQGSARPLSTPVDVCRSVARQDSSRDSLQWWRRGRLELVFSRLDDPHLSSTDEWRFFVNFIVPFTALEFASSDDCVDLLIRSKTESI